MASISEFDKTKKDFVKSKIEKLAPIVAKWEGGYVNDPDDKGGATNMGVTLATWKLVGYDKDNDGDIDSADIRLLTKEDFKAVLQKYWNKWRADEIKNQSVANILVDWYWGSGKWGIVIPQRILGIVQDGVVGPKTIAALNAVDQEQLFEAILAARDKFLDDIVKKKPSQKKFIKGWKNRLADFSYKAV
jgi:lysozyme family protein